MPCPYTDDFSEDTAIIKCLLVDQVLDAVSLHRRFFRGQGNHKMFACRSGFGCRVPTPTIFQRTRQSSNV
ncbi:hypothetical protein, partial [Microseira wollei]|uniref:hypothetical protein n=1 Tax=Microseira wollei TaxID=467598 RepID=UPI001CFC8E6A